MAELRPDSNNMDTKPVILLLNDETFYLEIVSLELKRQDFECICATNNEQALAILRSQRIDLLIQDMCREHGDSGIELYKTLKADAQLKSVPVLFNPNPESFFESIRDDLSIFGDGILEYSDFKSGRIREFLNRRKNIEFHSYTKNSHQV